MLLRQSKCILLVIGLILIAGNSEAKMRPFGVSLSGGMGVLNRASGNPPDTVSSGLISAAVSYAFNEMFGLAASADFHVPPPYDIYVKKEIPSEEPVPEGQTPTTVIGWVKGPHVKRSFLSCASLEGIYFIDMLAVRPYIVLGFTGMRSDLYVASPSASGYAVSGYAWSVRVGLGADYLMKEWLGLGVLALQDIIIVGSSSYYTRLAVMARATYFFGPAKL